MMVDVHIELKVGDNDTKKKWGGNVLAEAPAYTIEQLQKDLKSVGVYTGTEDGDFGGKTEKALKIFQWACLNIDVSIVNQLRVARAKSSALLVNGKLSKITYIELAKWISNGQAATGDLVRVSFSLLDNVQAGSGFKKIASTKVLAGELVVSKGALQLIKDLNAQAKAKKVNIKVNQVLRISGVKVNSAVVPPATKSQHLIGHAIDCNIVDGSNWNNSSTFSDEDKAYLPSKLSSIREIR